jgi:hypothetical protein
MISNPILLYQAALMRKMVCFKNYLVADLTLINKIHYAMPSENRGKDDEWWMSGDIRSPF